MANIEKLNTRLKSVRERMKQLQKQEKELSLQIQMAEDAQAMKIIKQKKISADDLSVLQSLKEDEISALLAQAKENQKQHNKQVKEIMGNE